MRSLLKSKVNLKVDTATVSNLTLNRVKFEILGEHQSVKIETNRSGGVLG
jgi:hypothetical protein